MFHVATFGHRGVGVLASTIGNHNETVHETREDARVQQFIDMARLINDGYKFEGKWEDGEGDAAEEAYKLSRWGTHLNVGLWEY